MQDPRAATAPKRRSDRPASAKRPASRRVVGARADETGAVSSTTGLVPRFLIKPRPPFTKGVALAMKKIVLLGLALSLACAASARAAAGAFDPQRDARAADVYYRDG